MASKRKKMNVVPHLTNANQVLTNDSPCIVSLCHAKNAYHSNKAKFFAVLHLNNHSNNQVELNMEEDCEHDKIVLKSTNEFHEHYGIQRDVDDLVVGPVSAFPLSKVLLAARTEETFKWAKEKGFETGLMVTGSLHKNLLVRLDDQFLVTPHKTFNTDPKTMLEHFKNLVAVECIPVKQGYIHVNTEVIISRMNTEKIQTRENNRSMLNETLFLKYVNQDLLRQISFNGCSFDQHMDVICCPSTAETLGFKDGDYVKLEITSPAADINDESLEKKQMNAPQTEEEYLSIDLPSNSTVTDQESRNEEKHAICRLRIGCQCDHNAFSHARVTLEPFHLYLSPHLWFNMKSCRDFFSDLEQVEAKLESLEEEDLPPFASEIHLSLVLSPTYSPKGQFDNTLIKYISEEKIVKKNDVIEINTTDNTNFLSECEAKDIRCTTLYYKVMGFSPKEDDSAQTYFRFDLKHTSLYQDGAVNSFIPDTIETSPGISIPAGLCGYVEKLRNIMRPYISMDMNHSTATILVSGGPACGKWSVVSAVCRLLNLHTLHINCYELMADSSGAMDAKISTAIQRATVYPPCAVVLNSIECIGRDRETGKADHRVCSCLRKTIATLQYNDYPIIVIAMTSNKKELVADIKSQFLHQVEMSTLSEKERLDMLMQLLKLMQSGRDVDIPWLAKHTVGFSYGDIWEILRQSAEEAKARITKECAVGSRLSWKDEMNICAAGITTQHCDFESALKQMQSQRADVIGVPKIPNVKWEDIGGLEEVKQDIKDTIQLPLEHPELVASGLRRSGILLYGPPGTGKTLLAKAVATQCSLSFLSVKGPELINMYVGQSEENVREIFSRARDAAPCVVFFDELDSLAPNRGRSGDSGGVMDRVVSQLLAELDGLVEADTEKQMFVIGASNRPDLIDPALLRPGRFDKLIYVGINTNKLDQLKILEAQTRKINRAADVYLDKVIDECPENMTGADFYALTSESVMNAIRRKITEESNPRSLGQESLVVEQRDFLKAAQSIKPSVSAKELSRFLAIKEKLVSR